jgi:hypothetical protein
MNKKQAIILLLAVIAFGCCIFVNLRGLISFYSSNEASATWMMDPRPMLAEFLIMAIIFGILFMIFRTPKIKG